MRQFHHYGYVSTNPRVQVAAGVGKEERPAEVPTEVDVLIVGAGPAGMLMLAQLSQFGSIRTAMIEKRGGRLVLGHADGVQQRSVETFQAFGFAEDITAEAYRITETCFWKPDPKNPDHIIRTTRTDDDPAGISEFPHLIVNQARILDYFREFAANSEARLAPYYGYEFTDLVIREGEEYPVECHLLRTDEEHEGEAVTVRAKYVFGADGAHSRVRKSIGAQHLGKASNHAWGVLDTLVNTDFPDIRTKCIIQSKAGSILHIPREGGYLVRIYVDLGEVPEGDKTVRQTPLESIIEQANRILSPYTLDVKEVAWWSVYEVGHRVTDRFDEIPVDEAGTRDPHVFIAGDACHTHSAKAGQGMNVSMQDAFNLGWKLASVLRGLAPASLLQTYTAERQQIAQDLIDFDSRWSSMMVKEEEGLTIEDFYVQTAEFPAGFMTQYRPSILTQNETYQELATGFPIGKRFKSAWVSRLSDGNPLQLGHLHEADGRWRIYAFADAANSDAKESTLRYWAEWMEKSPASPITVHTPKDWDRDALFDVKVIYQQGHRELDMNAVPAVFKPATGPLRLYNLEKIFGVAPDSDIFAERGLSRDGVAVVVRPDMYVGAVMPLDQPELLGEFFVNIFNEAK